MYPTDKERARVRLVTAFGAGVLAALLLPCALSVLLCLGALTVIGSFFTRNQHKE